MGLIIKDKIKMFIKGFPTVSDKYNVSGAMLESTSGEANFGDIVLLGDTNGFFKAVGNTTITNVNQIGGIILGTNVKVANEWPGNTVTAKPGEGFNLMISGFMAIQVDNVSELATITANRPVYITPQGRFTSTASGNIALTSIVFTGMVEETPEGNLLAEIFIR